MHAWVRSALALTTINFVALNVLNVVSVYGFDQFEPMWGRGPSFQVGVWIVIVACLACLIGSAFGYRAGSHRNAVPGVPIVAVTGVLVLCVSGGITYLLAPLLDAARPPVAFAVVVVSAAALSYLSCIMTSGGAGVLSNKSLERTRGR